MHLLFIFYGAVDPQGFIFPFHFTILLTSVFHATFRALANALLLPPA